MRTPAGGVGSDVGAGAPTNAPDTSEPPSPPAVAKPATAAPVSSDSPVIETARPESGQELHVEAALAASTRAEATLSALYRAIQQVTAGVSGAREANDQLAAELQRVREMLGASNEQRLMLKNQVTLLESQLEEARGEFAREREFLIAEQDKFLTGLLEEHNEVVDRLVREREEAYAKLEQALRRMSEPPPRRGTNPGFAAADATPLPGHLYSEPAPNPELEKLVVERDRARDLLRRLQTQRDEAQQELQRVSEDRDRLAAELSKLVPGRVPTASRTWGTNEETRRTVPAVPSAVSRVTDPSPPQKDRLGQSIIDRATSPPPPEALAAIQASRPSPPHGTAKAAPVTEPPEDGTPVHRPTPSIDKKPPLKRKPDPTTMPLGGYSLSGDEVSTEEVEPPSSRPPRRG